jgi:hypothetical protein
MTRQFHVMLVTAPSQSDETDWPGCEADGEQRWSRSCGSRCAHADDAIAILAAAGQWWAQRLHGERRHCPRTLRYTPSVHSAFNYCHSDRKFIMWRTKHVRPSTSVKIAVRSHTTYVKCVHEARRVVLPPTPAAPPQGRARASPTAAAARGRLSPSVCAGSQSPPRRTGLTSAGETSLGRDPAGQSGR